MLVPHEHPLARVSGSFNAVMLRGREIREIMLQGPGAGGAETATAVIGDLLSVLGPRPAGEVGDAFRELPLEPPGRARSPLYVHLEVTDRPGVLARIAAVFGDRGISLGAMIQRPHPGDLGLARLPHPPGLGGERPLRGGRDRNARLLPRPAARPARARRVSTSAGLLQSGDGRRLLAAQLFDSLGAGVGLVALPWLVLDAGGDASTAGLVAVFGLVPYVLFGLFAGVTGDRRSRKRVIIAAHATQTLWRWPCRSGRSRARRPSGSCSRVAFAIGIARTFADAAAFGAIAQIVGPAQFGRAQGLLSTVWATGHGERAGARRPADRGRRPEPRDRGAVRRVRAARRSARSRSAARCDRRCRTSAGCARRSARASTSSATPRWCGGSHSRRSCWNLAFYGSEALIVPFLRDVIELDGQHVGWVLGVGALIGIATGPLIIWLEGRTGAGAVIVAASS